MEKRTDRSAKYDHGERASCVRVTTATLDVAHDVQRERAVASM